MSKKWLLNRRHALWLGLATFAGIGTLAKGRAMYQSAQIQALDNPKRDFTVVGEASLKERAAAKGLIYGAAARPQMLSSDSAFANSFAKECAMLVPEGALKIGALRPSPTRFDFTEGDAFLEFAHTHNLLFRGHTLLWGNDQDFVGSQWLRNTVNSENAEQVLTNHIRTVVEHYAGKIHSWDVVNEVIDLSHGRPDGLAKTRWLEFIGLDYIDLAFRTAAAADPKALLVLNDAGFEPDAQEHEVRRAAVLQLLRRLKSQGTPVHALGLQSHLEGDITKFSLKNLNAFQAFLRDVAGLGLKILITELDVIDKNLPLDINVRDRMVAGIYEDYLSAVLDEPAVIAVVTWGLSDRYTWYSQFHPRKDKAPVRPLPLDDQQKRKLAWNAFARAFDKAPRR